MSALIVEDPGLCSAVQDLGRTGVAHLGVARSGAFDTLAHRLANRLLANTDDDATIETTLTGAAFRVTREAHVTIAGAPCDARIESDNASRPAPMLRPLRVRAGETIVLGPCTAGARTYLAIDGGVQTEPVMRSRSTHATTGFGHALGRTLEAGDELPLTTDRREEITLSPAHPRERRALLDLVRTSLAERLRIIEGPFVDALNDRDALARAAFRVGTRSDRVGVRLEDGALALRHDAGALDPEAMHPGAIQATPDGTLVALGPDGAPTGGYPVVASVIGVDLDALGQLRPGRMARLERVTLDRARELLRERGKTMDALLGSGEDGRDGRAHDRSQR